MISLCMIVRDEARQLPRFLAGTDGLWDELCVADTGSCDETREILQQAGAKIIDFPWIDDFSAARNASLALATGDWIIYLDADEYPAPALIDEIRALEHDAQTGAATLLIQNLREQGKVEEQRLLRMFRRDGDIRFEHAIHESIAGPVATMLAERNLSTRHLGSPVEHIGYHPSLMQRKNKRERDRRILENCLARQPGDLYSGFKLLELANYWSDAQLAEQTARHLHRQLQTLPPEALTRNHWFGDLLARVARTLYLSTPDEALRFLAQHPITPSRDYLETRGLCLEALGHLAAAEHDFSAALALCRQACLPGPMHVGALLGLGRVKLGVGDMIQAKSLIDQAIGLNPKNATSLRYALLIAELGGGKPAVQQYCRELGELYGVTQTLADLAAEFGLTVAVTNSVLAP